MSISWVSDLQPYLALIAPAASITTLGFVLKLGNSMRQAARDRAEILEERVKNITDDLERTEKWSEREKEILTKQNEELQAKLERILDDSGLSVQTLSMGQSLEHVKEAIQSSINELVSKMEAVDKSAPVTESANWHLQLAKGHMAQQEWTKAAIHFDRYCEIEPFNFEIQFSRGLSHANRNADREANIMALRAYNEAIALIDNDVPKNIRARAFVYRGAMLKRLTRLDEALADFGVALSIADEKYEINDIRYNLACVYAMQGDRRNMMEMIKLLNGCTRELRAIKHHLNDYFHNFSEDGEFLGIIKDY